MGTLRKRLGEWLATVAEASAVVVVIILALAYIVTYIGFPFAVLFVGWHFIRKHW